MSENPVPEPEKKLLSRRDLLKLPFQRPSDATQGEASDEHQQRLALLKEKLYPIIVTKLLEKSVSRRKLIVATALLGVGTTAAVDTLILKGKGREYLNKLLFDPIFQEKLLDSFQSGEFFEDDLPQLLEQGRVAASIELGETLPLTEEWMDQVFASYEIRKLENSGEYTDKLVLIAELGRVDILEAETYAGTSVMNGAQIANAEATAAANEPYAVLPRSQMKVLVSLAGDSDYEYHQLTELKYNKYQLKNGEIATFGEEGENFRGGALVLIGDSLQVIDASEMHQYQVGAEDVRGFRVVNYTIRSEHRDTDMAEITQSETLGGFDMDYTSYPSFMATFVTSSGEKKTYVMSTYSHFDRNQPVDRATQWQKRRQFNLTQMTEMCAQMMQEHDFTSYIIAVTDDDEYGAVVTSETYTSDEVKQLVEDGILDLPTDFRRVKQSAEADLANGMSWQRTLWNPELTQFSIPVVSFVAKG